MSKLSRYNLLISSIRSGLECSHNLGIDRDSQEHNHLITLRSLEAWIFLTEDLMCENEIKLQARDTRISNLILFLNTHHISLTLTYLKEIYDIIINHISGKSVCVTYDDFKGQITQGLDSKLGFLLSPIKESLSRVIQSQTFVSSGCYKSDVTRDVWICAHYLQFLNKLNYKGIGLEEKALQDYLSFEAETASLEEVSYERYLPAIQKILSEWLKEWDYDGYMPSHGPGSVADAKCNKLDKYYNLSLDDRTRYLYGEDHPSVLPFWHKQTFERVSKLVFVPKNITKLRSISMEPATLQYLQQGCMKSLYSYFKVQPLLRNILKLQDQHQNKSFAYTGSITNDYATIDLSHASDSVNWKMTKQVFKRVPKLLKWLVCTRSTHTQLPTGEVLALAKFAPMGSALCFPIESLIFAAIAKLSVLLSREACADRDDLTGLRSSIRNITVYGDDIILPTYAAKLCIEILESFGFSPNNEKSYLSGPFKESCGGNYFCGCDITPVKFHPEFSMNSVMGVSPEAYSALSSYANLAYVRGLTYLRLYCIKLIFEGGLMPIFSDRSDTSPAIYSPTPTNFHLRKIYRKRYQKYQYQYTGIKEVDIGQGTTSEVDEDIYYFDNLLTLHRRPLIETTNNATVIQTDINNLVCYYLGGKIKELSVDRKVPYSRSSTLTKALKFTLCHEDI